ncbi:PIG-L deacetylase family protein [Parabacteroides sp. AM08-6]|uniref:PIG-L deacetylase family protein n=1 Tax=Parabacteroides sp. AM08-6 TaxID=2292053 RepID=UPI000F00E2DC|nr:PIG-L family deacetylase [Parabacteroides sp. AM08-6]RHJ84389.1 PIG-L family deacetylase [Parabacteroides sp. AM08-6]
MTINNYNNILVLAPHTDDGELGLGGTISQLIELGKKVTYVAFSTAQQSVPDGFPKDILKTEVKRATAKLGILPENLIIYDYEVRKLGYVRQEILEELIRLRKDNSFDLVFMPCLHDIHQDHTTIAQEGLRAFKNTTLLGYELIWNNLTFNAQCFVQLDKQHIKAKVEALKEYESQGARDYLSEEFLYSLAKSRGVQAGCPYAEAFEVIRLFL